MAWCIEIETLYEILATHQFTCGVTELKLADSRLNFFP